jgi:hypothetical protein
MHRAPASSIDAHPFQRIGITPLFRCAAYLILSSSFARNIQLCAWFLFRLDGFLSAGPRFSSESREEYSESGEISMGNLPAKYQLNFNLIKVALKNTEGTFFARVNRKNVAAFKFVISSKNDQRTIGVILAVWEWLEILQSGLRLYLLSESLLGQ